MSTLTPLESKPLTPINIMSHIKNLLNLVLNYKQHRIVRIKKGGLTGVDLDHDFQLLIGDEKITCLDIGANRGQTIDIFLRLFKNPTIHAFEPSSNSYKSLLVRQKSMKNSWSNVHLHCFGMGKERCRQTFNNYENSLLNSLLTLQDSARNPFRKDIENLESTETVDIDTVDNFIDDSDIKTLDILKIDTQGYDFNVLKGAEKSLRDGKIKYIFLEMNFVEMYNDQGSATEMIDYLNRFDRKVIGFYDVCRQLDSDTISYCSVLFGPY